MPQHLHFPSRSAFRAWLEENHSVKPELWLVYYKKHTGKESVSYEDGVCEAICFGWIDGKVMTIDDDCYKQRFSPRRKNSKWSELNKRRAEKMMSEGSMTEAGMRSIEEAKANGKWDESTSRIIPDMPPELFQALQKNKTAFQNFNNFANSYRNLYIAWVSAAKREETKLKRIAEVVRRAEINEKPGML